MAFVLFRLFVYFLLCGRLRDGHPCQVAFLSVMHASIYIRQKKIFFLNNKSNDTKLLFAWLFSHFKMWRNIFIFVNQYNQYLEDTDLFHKHFNDLFFLVAFQLIFFPFQACLTDVLVCSRLIALKPLLLVQEPCKWFSANKMECQ